MNEGGLFQGLKDESEGAGQDSVRDQFRTRREVIPERRNRGSDDTIHTFSLRCRVISSNVFVRFCNERRLTYREGFDLVAELLTKMDEERG
jgi:hypothetical protein